VTQEDFSTDSLESSQRGLGEQLGALAERYPKLISRGADLQSRLAEQLRSAPPADDVPLSGFLG
jgi:hypothetical protein